MGLRRKARVCALQILFQFDFQSGDCQDLADRYWESNACPDKVRCFADRLVEGTMEHLEEIDSVIKQYTIHWKPERIFAVDRNIMRLASYEILYMDDIPVKVSIDEALEIAKRYGTEDSSKFINGILDKIAKSINKKQIPVS